MPDCSEGPDGNMFTHETYTDGGHAKAELALRFLEYTTNGIKQLSEFDGDQKKSIREIEIRCWVIVSDYFRP